MFKYIEYFNIFIYLMNRLNVEHFIDRYFDLVHQNREILQNTSLSKYARYIYEYYDYFNAIKS